LSHSLPNTSLLPVEAGGSLTHRYESQAKRFTRAFDVLRTAIADRVFPGASLAVAYDGELIIAAGFGRFTYDPDSPEVTASTIFDLASITKVVAGTSMSMILYERGSLDLDMPVYEIIPEFAGDDARRQNVTVRMLLAHSSGLPGYEKLFLRTRSCGELVRAAWQMELTADPGTRTEYSDIGFIVLGSLLERVAGENLDVFCRREVFERLQMKHTDFNPRPEIRGLIPPTASADSSQGRLIQGEVNDENCRAMGGVSTYAGLFAPAIDLALFAQAMLQGGKPLISLRTLRTFTRREPQPRSSRALGWDTPGWPSQSGKYFSPGSFGHLGYTGTSLWIDPERQLSITLLSNRTWPDVHNHAIKRVRPAVYDAVIEALEKNR
jgi:CubicO group peptidase (beta-lactamase class C family)